MKKHPLTLLILLLSLFSNPAFSQADAFLKDYLERWETSRQYTLAVAEAMPENTYDFSPTSEEMTFGEQLMHIAVILDWHGFSKVDGQEYPPRWDDYKVEGRSKQEIVDILNLEFDRVATLIRGYDASRMSETGSYGKFTRTRRQFLMLMADHITHHRGQLVVYLRLQGIKPPNYIEYQ